MRCGVPSSKIIQNFKMTTAEHLTKHGALWDCTGHTPTELAWILYLLKILIFYSSWVFFLCIDFDFQNYCMKILLILITVFSSVPINCTPEGGASLSFPSPSLLCLCELCLNPRRPLPGSLPCPHPCMDSGTFGLWSFLPPFLCHTPWASCVNPICLRTGSGFDLFLCSQHRAWLKRVT